MNTIIDKVKQSVVALAVGAVFTLIPFYFETSAMTIQNEQTNKEQGTAIEQISNDLHKVELQSAVGDTEIKQIKQQLERIEKKIDRLIEIR